MLRRFLGNVVHGRAPLGESLDAGSGVRRVLNVGGANKSIPIPAYYDGWEHVLLDIAPGPDVDVVSDARRLIEQPAGTYDAIYCSHNLEHYYRHDSKKVLEGFVHVLRDEGFVDIRVPDMASVLKAMVEGAMDIDDVLYVSPAGPITVHDVIYGWGKEIERSGVDFFAHKQGFTPRTLVAAVKEAGFATVRATTGDALHEIRAYGFKAEPSEQQKAALGL